MKVTKAAFLIACDLLFQLVSMNTSRTTDCTSHCVSKRFCRSEQPVLRDICNYKDGGCHTTDAAVCNATLLMMLSRSPALGECVCSGPDPCRALQQLYSQCQHRLAQKNKQPEAKWKASVHHTSRSCLEETKACLGEQSCNWQMVPFVQECNAYQCSLSRCRDATRQFYSALPHDVAERLVFCNCDREDQECQQMKASLHSGSCASDPSQTPWTCLEALDRCFGDVSCRQIFNRYLSKCFGAEDAAYDSPSEWLNLINPDIFIGEDLQCRVAFVETMGSILHHPCTCDGLHHHDQYKCNELKLIFQDKSFFKLSKTKESIRHGESNMRRQPTNEPSVDQQLSGGETVQHQSDDLRNGQQPTNESRVEQQWLSHQLLHLLIYVSALTVVVLFVVSLLLLRLSPSDIHQGTSVCLVSFPADTRHLDPDVFESNDVFPEPQCQEHTKSPLGTSPQTLMRRFTKAVVLPLMVKLLSQRV